MQLKKYLIIILFFISGNAFAQCNELFFSEYVEPGTGFGGCKVVEIYNPSSSAINLAGYVLFKEANGSCTGNLQSFALPPVLLNSHDVYVVNSGPGTTIPPLFVDPLVIAARDTVWSNLNFNGNDAVYLVNPAGFKIDVIGIVCDASISTVGGWQVGSNITDSTLNITLVRNPTINAGDTTWATASTTWTVYPLNDFTHLGSHTMYPCGLTPSVVEFSNNYQNATENAGTVNIPVILSNPNSDTTFVDVQILNSSATAGTDYTYTTQTLVFLPNSTTPQNASISLINDFTSETSEYITFQLVNASNALLTPIIGTNYLIDSLEIIDDDGPAPYVEITPCTASYNESIGSVNVTLTITNPNNDTTFVTIAQVGGTATNIADFSFVPTQVMFLPNSNVSQIVTLNVVNDILVEGTEDIDFAIVGISNDSAYAIIGNLSEDTITIIDDDFPSTTTVNFTSPVSMSTNETNTVLNISIQTNPSLTNGLDSAFVSISGGSAILGTDYNFTNQYVYFSPTTNTATVSVSILDDCLPEGAETIQLHLGNVSSGILLGIDSIYTITINSNDTLPILNFATTNSVVNESAGTLSTTINISNTYCDTVKFDVNIIGTANNGLDFVTINSPINFVIAPNSVLTTTISTTIIDDNITEATENIIFQLSPILNCALGLTPTTNIDIIDNDIPVVFNFNTPTSAIVSENVGTVNATVTASAAPNAGSVSVDISAFAGTASNIADYNFANTTFTVASGSTTLSLTNIVNIINDCLPENAESFTLKLSNAVGLATIGADSIFTIQIKSNDTLPTVSFGTSTISGLENLGVVNIPVSLNNSYCDTVIVQANLIAGSATLNTDFTASSPYTLTFLPGTTTQNITISLIDDIITEITENLQFGLQIVSGATLGTNTILTYNILDNDVNTNISFNASSVNYIESAGTVLIPISISAAPTVNTNITVTIASGTATSGADYTVAATTQTVTFLAGSTASQNITVQIIDDAIFENTEFFTLTLSNPTNGSSLGSTVTNTVNILDNETSPIVRTISFAVNNMNAAENCGSVAVVAQVANINNSPVNFTISMSGTATSGADYTAIANNLTIPANTSTYSFTIPIIDDNIVELSENISIQIVSSSAAVGGPNTCVVQILDNDTLANGINNIETNTPIVYPNPTSINSTLQFKNVQNNDVIILYDITGKELMQENLQANTNISLQKLNAGIFIYKIYRNKELLIANKLVITQ